MDAADWDERYRAADLVWSRGPNMFVEQLAAPLQPGTALDVAAGEGRHAIWLAERGWTVTAVDFSGVALSRARSLAAERLGPRAATLTTVQADALTYRPRARAFDLVVVAYLQLRPDDRRTALRAAADGVAAGGRLLVVAHDSANLDHGFGGPSDPTVLYSAADAAADVDGTGLSVLREERVTRRVTTADGERVALDCLLLAERPTSAAVS